MKAPVPWLALCLLLGIWLRNPVLDAGLRDDDHVQLAMLEGAFPIARGPLDLFWFSGRSAEENRALQEAGYLPWWASERLRLGMLRPLSSALVALDHRVARDDPWLRHVHSLAWWALVVIAAGVLLSQVLPPRAAMLAVLVYAVDESHTLPLAYLANRAALVSTGLGLLAVAAHVRWRQGIGGRHGPWLEAGVAGLALCGGEYALSVLAYVLAYELCASASPWRERLSALLPTAAPAALYLATRAALGYGVRASGHYVSPLELPRYLAAAAWRVPVLVGDAVLGVPSMWWQQGTPLRERVLRERLLDAGTLRALPDWQAVQVALGVVALGLLLGAFVWARRRGGDLRHLPWLALGALGSLVPVAGTLPSERTLLAAALGVAALVAALADRALLALQRAGVRALPALALSALLGVHLGVAGFRSHALAAVQPRVAAALTAWAARASIPKAGVSDLDVAVVSAADFTTAASLPWVRRTLGAELPRSYRLLDASAKPLELTHVAPGVLDLRVLASDVAESAAGSLYRPVSDPIVAGYRVRLHGMEVEVLEARAGNPVHTRVHLGGDGERVLLLQAGPHGLVPLARLAVGAERMLPAPRAPRAP